MSIQSNRSVLYGGREQGVCVPVNDFCQSVEIISMNHLKYQRIIIEFQNRIHTT